MKQIYDLTEEEIVSLTEEQVMKYIDYECALAGAPMLPPSPGPKPVKDLPKPDVTMFEIAGYLIDNSDHAGKILAALSSGTLYHSQYGRNYQVTYASPIRVREYNYPKIETKTLYSVEQWDKIKDIEAANATAEDQWNEINSEYQKAVTARTSITDKVWEYYNAIFHKKYQRDQLRKEFDRYLELAEGNKKIALAFLQKAKDLSDFPELVEEWTIDPPPDEEDEKKGD